MSIRFSGFQAIHSCNFQTFKLLNSKITTEPAQSGYKVFCIMLLMNWLRSISKRCRSPRVHSRNRARRLTRQRNSVNPVQGHVRSSTNIEQLEDRTLLTSVFNISSEYLIDEGDSGYTIYTFTVTRTRETQGGLNSVASVDFNTTDDTALAGSDYVPFSTQLTFEASSSAYRQTQTVEVMIIGDSLVEKDEYFKGELSNNSAGTTINSSTSYSKILNDDQATVSINDVTVNETAGTAELTISVDGPFESTFNVSYSTISDTAISDEDYSNTGGYFFFRSRRSIQNLYSRYHG